MTPLIPQGRTPSSRVPLAASIAWALVAASASGWAPMLALSGVALASVASALATVRRLKRVRKQIREERAVAKGPMGHPGPLMDFVPRAWPGFAKPVHLVELAAAITRSVTEAVEMCFSVPVRHGKTTLLVAAVVWLLLAKPDAQILYVSYAHGFAARQVARALAIARMLGIPLDRESRDDWTTKFGGRVKATGITGQLAGEGFTHIIVDDPHKNRAEAESQIIREGVIEAFWNDIYTRQVPSGTSVFIVHARWHPNDLIGVVSRGDKPFAYINYPAIDALGKALAPFMWAVEKLLEIKAKVGPYVWASLYDGNPKPRGGTLFRTIHAAPIETLLEHTGPSAVTIGLDFARTAKTRSDHHAAVAMRKTQADRKGADGKPRWMYDLLEAVEMRGTITDQRETDGAIVEPGFTRELARMARAYPGCRWAWYAARSEEWLAELVENAVNEELKASGHKGRIRIRILTIDTNQKWLRAQGWGATMNDGLARIASYERDVDPEKCGHMDALVAEHGEFTGQDGNKDNLVDAAVAAHDDLDDVKPGAPPQRGRGTGEGSVADRMSGLF